MRVQLTNCAATSLQHYIYIGKVGLADVDTASIRRMIGAPQI